MTYQRIQHERRQEFLAEMEDLGIGAADHGAVRTLAIEMSRTDDNDVDNSEWYAEGFARGLTGSLVMHEHGDVPYGKGRRDLELGYANGFVTRRILAGKLPAMAPAGTPR